MILVWSIFLGWLLERAQTVMCANNYGAPSNGFGAIHITNNRTALAPMAYRVLVPWLVWLIERIFPEKNRILYYQALKLLLSILVVWAVWVAWSFEVMLVFMLLLLLTFKYDYWDWAAEMAGIALAMTGDLAMALPGAVLHGLSRETALLTPVVYYTRTGDLKGALVIGAAAALTLISVRMIVGPRKLYCNRFMIRENIEALMNIHKWVPFWQSDIFMSVAVSALALAALISFPTGWIAPVAILGAGWTMAKADETRVFTPVLPWVAAFLIGV